MLLDKPPPFSQNGSKLDAAFARCIFALRRAVLQSFMQVDIEIRVWEAFEFVGLPKSIGFLMWWIGAKTEMSHADRSWYIQCS